MRCFACLFLLCLLSFSFAQPPDDRVVRTSAPSQDALLSTARLKLMEGLKAELYAAEPLLANPVAFCFDPQGRIYVAETYRLHRGVTDNRNHMYWLDDDLACRTVADRDAKYRKHLKGRYADFAKATDRVRLLIDTKNTGKPDTSYVFSDGYRNAVDGIGSGVLVHDGSVYYTCIPDLWRLRDTKGTHHADVRESLSTGYGVHTSFIGHDTHGLVISPVDGKLYFSIGDRGATITTKEGRKIEVPHTGAVFRCNLDGSDLELYARGLRNPQELVFDDFGNLFTGENNSDSGDRARFVYLPEGADCGWHIGWQYLEQPYSRGSWNAEFMWHPPRPDQPAFIVPPITNLGDGPSGLTFYPGTGLAERYKNHFFLADFRGTPASSGIRSFAVKPKGAGFVLTDSHQFAWGVLATDVDFGPDSALYILDWVEVWGITGKGRIHRVWDPKTLSEASEVKRLLAADWTKMSIEELSKLLSHPDRRVRTQAQFTLVERPNGPAMLTFVSALNQGPPLARLHAIWGLGQLWRTRKGPFDSPHLLKSFLNDPDVNVVVNVLRIASNHSPLRLAVGDYVALFNHPSDQVRAQAAHCLGKQQVVEALPALLDLIKNSQLRDPWLRHACAMGLMPFLAENKEQIVAAGQHSPAIRLAVVLAYRHLDQPPATFLLDTDPLVRNEAIRACHDLLNDQGLTAVATVSFAKEMPEPILLRILNAQLHQGKAENAERLAAFAADSAMPTKVRLEAVKMLAAWEQPSGRDWVTGLWKTIERRSAAPAQTALTSMFPKLLDTKGRLAAEAIKAAGRLQLATLAPSLLQVARDLAFSSEARVAALNAADDLKAEGLSPTVTATITDKDPRVRSAAQAILVKLNPAEAVLHLARVLDDGELRERQAIFAQLAGMRRREADQVLERWLTRFAEGTVPGELQFDLVQAAKRRNLDSWKSLLDKGQQKLAATGPYGPYRTALLGGDAEAGRKVFFEKTAVACLRCHRVGREGGEVGPDLTKIAHDKSRDYLLESIVDPNKTIAKDFELSIILTADGVVQQGIVKSETESEIRLITPEAKSVIIKKADVEERKTGKSAMPEDLIQQLSLRELRDLIQYLATLK
jgi:quinoprotein glucose dehydrogenase